MMLLWQMFVRFHEPLQNVVVPTALQWRCGNRMYALHAHVWKLNSLQMHGCSTAAVRHKIIFCDLLGNRMCMFTAQYRVTEDMWRELL